MKKLILAISLALSASSADAECWRAVNFEGRSAPSNERYGFIRDTFQDGMRICISGDAASVTGSDLRHVVFGRSTLIGWSENGHGLEVVNVYQIDRSRQKLLFTQSRIGTATMMPILPDYAAAFVADLVPD
jgi:hypothetical protein